ncbi:MAG: potassium-transporting ATPase subunit KdpA [Bacteroidetes bacterium]|nr:potassium-transporting ATPase subunit KdpA [Bacteroidota bacterium]
MNYLNDLLQLLIFVGVLVLLSVPLGNFFAKVFQGERNFLSPVFSKIESAFYRLVRINTHDQMDWKEYAVQLLIFNLLGFLVLFIIQIVQQSLPLNPQHLPNVDLLLALNTAVSFTTNTNWQSYAGETTLSYFVQMIGMTVQNFLSAATGIAVMIALIRGIATRNGKHLGNFWVDVTRAVLYVLLPLSFLLSIILISQGVVQTFDHVVTATTLEGTSQIIPLGPAVSQIAVKQLGTNGGGFFNTNSAFPFENPTPLSNFLQVLSILLIPASLVFTYGKMLGSKKHAWTIFSVMLFVFVFGVVVSYLSETANNPIFHTNQLMEGKETRFGIFNSVLWSVATTVASNGSVNSMISSMSPVSGLVSMLNIQLGEIIFGGVGSGLYGMFLFIVITVFISGLMVGRTPEYFGKKIEAYEIKFSILAVLLPSIIILVFTAVAVISNAGLSSLSNKGPHGLSEILYAFTSAGGNNGSAFAGLNTNTNFYNVLLALAMVIGRYGVIVPILAIAGSLVKKNIAPATTGTLATDNFLFAFLLFGVIIIVGALTFFPVLSIGPLLEHLLMNLKITF